VSNKTGRTLKVIDGGFRERWMAEALAAGFGPDKSTRTRIEVQAVGFVKAEAERRRITRSGDAG